MEFFNFPRLSGITLRYLAFGKVRSTLTKCWIHVINEADEIMCLLFQFPVLDGEALSLFIRKMVCDIILTPPGFAG